MEAVIEPNAYRELSLEQFKEKNSIDENIAKTHRKNTAIHEAGHALMLYLMDLPSFSVKMSYITPHGAYVCTPADAEELKRMILIDYAGGAAEELIIGHILSGSVLGAESDFMKAKEKLKAYAVMQHCELSKSFSDAELDPYIIKFSKLCYQETIDILSAHTNALFLISNNLLKSNTFSKDDVVSLLQDNNILPVEK